jgi:fructose-bisphosphate aldolase class 1
MAMQQTAATIAAPARGILAADESPRTIERRFQAVSLESTGESTVLPGVLSRPPISRTS